MNNNLKLKYYSSGSYGILIKDCLNNYIYKNNRIYKFWIY